MTILQFHLYVTIINVIVESSVISLETPSPTECTCSDLSWELEVVNARLGEGCPVYRQCDFTPKCWDFKLKYQHSLNGNSDCMDLLPDYIVIPPRKNCYVNFGEYEYWDSFYNLVDQYGRNIFPWQEPLIYERGDKEAINGLPADPPDALTNSRGIKVDFEWPEYPNKLTEVGFGICTAGVKDIVEPLDKLIDIGWGFGTRHSLEYGMCGWKGGYVCPATVQFPDLCEENRQLVPGRTDQPTSSPIQSSANSTHNLSSANPTHNPTDNPTHNPTHNPTQAPIMCYDYYNKTSSIVETTNLTFDYQLTNITTYDTYGASWTKHFKTNNSNNYLKKSIECFDTHCIVECIETASCLLSEIIMSVPITHCIFSLHISCEDQASCFGSSITTTTSTQKSNIVIICNGESSCNQMSVSISNFNSFILYCVGAQSCRDVNVYLDVNINHIYDDHGIIHCVSMHVCENLKIKTNAETTKLIMHEYSKNVILDNGVGYLSDLENIICNNDRYIQYKIWTTPDIASISNSIKAEYLGNEYPCADLMVKCGNLSCNMHYHIDSNRINDINNGNDTQCYWINIKELQILTCVGQCASSPTETPTSAPTNSPTSITKYPTINPTMQPTYNPTYIPSIDPTSTPTTSPTISPSNNPTTSPTSTPTTSPTISPSNNPTVSPTFSPSFTPTSAPSRMPTISNRYDSYVAVEYVLQSMSTTSIQLIAYNVSNVIGDITAVIETGYSNHKQASEWWHLEYHEFWLKIMYVNGNTINDLVGNERTFAILLEAADKEGIILTSRIECEEYWCNYIIRNYDKDKFEVFVQNHLNKYFNIQNVKTDATSESQLTFTVESMSQQSQLLHPPPPQESKYVFYFLISVTSLIVFVGILALLFNKGVLPKFVGSNIVDNGSWVAVIIFGFQFYDFASDANLCVDIWTRDDVWNDTVILIIAIASTVFVIVPYITNLIIAARIKNIIKNNEYAQAWFQEFTTIFCLLVVLTGGCFTALSLVSSNIFGLKVMSTGITQYELKQLHNIKIFGTIFIENLPQLIIQLLFTAYIKQITEAVGIAFFASLLSVIATSLGYLINRDNNETKAVEYYLSIQCEKRGTLTSNDVETMHVNTDTHLSLKSSSTLSVVDKITNDEKQSIMKNKGRRMALGEKLAMLFEMQPKNIEIGSTLIHAAGARIHVVHFVYDTEIKAMQESLTAAGDVANVDPKFYTKQLYMALEKEISAAFREHFGLSSKDFIVTYNDFLENKTMASFRASSINANKNTEKNEYKPSKKILEKTITLRGLGVKFTANSTEKSMEFAIKKYMMHVNATYNVKRNKILSLVDKLSDEKFDDADSLSMSTEKNEEVNQNNIDGIMEENEINNTVEMVKYTNLNKGEYENDTYID